MALDFGLLLAFRNPPRWRRSFIDIYHEHFDQAALAEELGYDTVWLTEHHFLEDGWSPSLLPIASAIAMRTSRIRIGTFIILLPLRNALEVAEDAATVDIISRGRLDLGVGQGYRVPEFVGFGIPRKERPSRLEEGLEVIRRAWTQDDFSFEGKHYQIKNATLMPKPVQRPHPPIWVAAMGPKAVQRAARFGFHLAGSGGENLQQMYDEALQKYGRDVDRHYLSQLRLVYIAETREKAWDDAQEHTHYMMASYHRWFQEAGDLAWFQRCFSVPQLPAAQDLRHAPELSFFEAPLIVGTPDDAVREIERYAAASRVTHLAMWMQLAGMDPRKVHRSMELFAKEVMPHFRR